MSFCLGTEVPRHSAGGSYVCVHVRKSKNLHMQTKLARMENVCLILRAQLQPHLGALSGGSEITNALSGIQKSALQEQIRAWRRARTDNLRSRRQALNSLKHGDKPGVKLKDNVDKDSK